MSLFCNIDDLYTESDVEQKLVVPLLTTAAPQGLGYRSSDYRTKLDLRKFVIDKGKNSKLYFPDYVIVLQGLPLLVVEVKNIDTPLDEAIREARLYATEINSLFSPGINPCNKCIVTNGRNILCFYSDSNNIEIELNINDLFLGGEKHRKLLEFASYATLNSYIESIFKTIRGNTVFVKPTRRLGGKSVVYEELEKNGFGTNLALEHRTLFNPNTIEDRKNIVKNAYVYSKKRMKHVNPIEKIIRAAKPNSIIDSVLIEDTEKPIVLMLPHCVQQ